MTQPRYVEISGSVPREHHAELAYLVSLVAEATGTPLQDCEVHVKYGKSRPYGRTSGYAYYTFDGKPWSGQVRGSRIQVQPGVKYLVTIKLYAGFWLRYQPPYAPTGTHVMHYERYKTAPYTTLRSWQEEFVYIVAHEFRHVLDYTRPRTRKGYARTSEIECEYAAILALDAYRLLRALEGTLPAHAVTAKAAHRS